MVRSTSLLSTRSTLGYPKITIQCTGVPSMHSCWGSYEILGRSSCCTQVSKVKNCHFRSLGFLMTSLKWQIQIIKPYVSVTAEFSYPLSEFRQNRLKGKILRVVWSEEGAILSKCHHLNNSSASDQFNALIRLKHLLRSSERKVLANNFAISSFNYCSLLWNFSSA